MGLGCRQENRKPFNKVFTIFIIIEYLSAFYSSDHDIMQGVHYAFVQKGYLVREYHLETMFSPMVEEKNGVSMVTLAKNFYLHDHIVEVFISLNKRVMHPHIPWQRHCIGTHFIEDFFSLYSARDD
ncbi:hypothetical protein BMS3Bbin14_00346 [bacterium BMS3Bbin14]|nr:hypothetical protein BMS3Bbin14_00346 [bacterium BMS3Bbin14]